MSILDKLGFAFLIMLIGLMIVFFGLIILICLIKLMSIIVGALTGKKKEQAAPAPAPVVEPGDGEGADAAPRSATPENVAVAAEPAEPEVVPAPVVVPEPVAEAAAEETGLENDELIAVITAALAAFNKDGNKTLVVRSVRRAAAKTPALGPKAKNAKPNSLTAGLKRKKADDGDQKPEDKKPEDKKPESDKTDGDQKPEDKKPEDKKPEGGKSAVTGAES